MIDLLGSIDHNIGVLKTYVVFLENIRSRAETLFDKNLDISALESLKDDYNTVGWKTCNLGKDIVNYTDNKIGNFIDVLSKMSFKFNINITYKQKENLNEKK